MPHSSFASWEEAVRWLQQQPSQASLVHDCYFDQPALAAANRYWRSDEWNAVRKLLPSPPGVALDLGAGNGIASFALSMDGWTTISLEPDPSDLVGRNAVRRLFEEANMTPRIVGCYGERVALASASSDIVLGRQVFHHARNLSTMASEVYRVLRPGGCLLAIREHVISTLSQREEFLNKHPLHKLYGGENAYTVKQYQQAFADSGLNVARTLGPWDSAINFAPLNCERLVSAARMKYGLTAGPLAFAAKLPGSFVLARSALKLLDRRPGRLYSFLCYKPR